MLDEIGRREAAGFVALDQAARSDELGNFGGGMGRERGDGGVSSGKIEGDDDAAEVEDDGSGQRSIIDCEEFGGDGRECPPKEAYVVGKTQ